MNNEKQTFGLGWLALFTSSGTLVCCALPILLVTLGMGASLAAFNNDYPILLIMSSYKVWTFSFAALLLSLTAWLIYRPGRHCPTDPQLAAQCQRFDKWNKIILWGSISIWGLGFFAAYLALPIMMWLDGA